MRRGATPLSEPTLTYISWIRPSETNFSEILIKTQEFSYKKNFENIFCKMAATLSRPQCVEKGAECCFDDSFNTYFYKMEPFYWRVSIKIRIRCKLPFVVIPCLVQQFVAISLFEFEHEQNYFHQIWIVIEKLLVKWVPGRYYFKSFFI